MHLYLFCCMSPTYGIPVWKKAPVLRLLLPFVAGILLQWQLQISLHVILAALISFSLALLLFFLLPVSLRFKFQPLQGFIIHLLLVGVGSLITWQKDTRHDKRWYGNHYQKEGQLLVRIEEPVIEKNRSFKAAGIVEAVIRKDDLISCKGKLLLYFSKDSFKNDLEYGERILIRKALQPIKNSGNPGAFNYQRYAAFQQTFHTVFLKEKDWIKTNDKSEHASRLQQFIFDAREYVLSVLRKRVGAGHPGSNRDELGIAEALLIGYTNDLDKDLVQAYSNTGVVHIIAISGMHLGLIYIMLVWLFARIPFVRNSKRTQAILILACLWLFSLLTGGAASVIRSAVMFTFITLGKAFFEKQSSIFSSLAASAFAMLCYDPYYLWDVGFQLSYLAVVGIVVFQRPLYNCFYFKNKWLDKVWQLMAVSTAAQLLTFPVCIYYFHQFPNLFLITNIIAVPLSAIILYAEIALLALSWMPFLGAWLGRLVAGLVWVMNKIILGINELPFAVWDQIPATALTTWLLYAVVTGFSAWLMTKNKNLFKSGLICLLIFTAILTYNEWQVAKQQKIIVYNVPRYQAIDFVNGTRYRFIGDRVLLEDGLLQNFHLKPGRISMQLNSRVDTMNDLFHHGIFYQFLDRRIVVINGPFRADPIEPKPKVDLVVISKDPWVHISELSAVFNCSQFVFDASNPSWKIEKWLKECSSLNVQGHSIPGQGAFILDIGM